ncbi:MAG: hypothetical protein ACK4NU_10970 [Brevundimonas sp.]
MAQRFQADELIRQRQQGLGHPIVAFKDGDQQFVAVKNRLIWSDRWKTFPDFLGDYIKQVFKDAWGKAEFAKPFAERHPIIQWYQAYCLYQRQFIKTPGEIGSGHVTGVVVCYLGLAYNLYLMEHNVELQARMIARLKDPANFQGAFYELVVAGALIRAGYELVLEDEVDRQSKHCEFAAIKKSTGKRYSVEAKMRAVSGMLGRTAHDGGSDEKPLGRLIPHLCAALRKPSEAERMVFIDINSPMDKDISEKNRPGCVEAAIRALERFERNRHAPQERAYIFVTNIACHRHLGDLPVLAIAPFGFNIPDFNRRGVFSHVDRYRQEQKHKDALEIAQALADAAVFPNSFDGRPPSELKPNEPKRLVVGETYDFTDAAPGGLIATVTSVAACEKSRSVMAAVMTPDGKGHLLHETMSEAAALDYAVFGENFFGEVGRSGGAAKNPYELFCGMMEVHADYNREQLARQLGLAADDPWLAHFNDSELREFIAERIVASADARSSS